MCAADTNGSLPRPSSQQRLPYQSVQDYLSNIHNFKIIESTLREGEDQGQDVRLSARPKVQETIEYQLIAARSATALSDFGVEYIELTSPVAWSSQESTARPFAAEATGVDGVDLVIGTSSFLHEHSHGKDMATITKLLSKSLTIRGIEVRFSSEDSFRSDLVDLLSLYKAVDAIGVDRVGAADTVGCATPRQVFELVHTLRGVVNCDIETHFHNDTGCAIANAYAALEAGATHIDTSVLGIGERNGITALGGLLARMIVSSPDYVRSRYQLSQLKDLENLVVRKKSPSTWPLGWNAIKSRSEQLGLSMSDGQYKILTAKIKQMADIRPLAIDDTDSIIRAHHHELENPA
ncbi:homocitrate synthase, partial [Metarhizium majus ARSEF 297]